MNILNLPIDIQNLIYDELGDEQNKIKFMICKLSSKKYIRNKNQWYIPRKIYSYFDNFYFTINEQLNSKIIKDYFRKLKIEEKIKIFKDLGYILCQINQKQNCVLNKIRYRVVFWNNDLQTIKNMKDDIRITPELLKINYPDRKRKNTYIRDKINGIPSMWNKQVNKSTLSLLLLPKLNTKIKFNYCDI